MGFCERIKTERVLYDQTVFVQDREFNVPLGLPEGFALTNVSNPAIAADITHCDLDLGTRPPTVTLTAHIILSFTGTVTTPERGTQTRDFVFSFDRTLAAAALPKLDILVLTEDEIRRAFCQVFDVTALEEPSLDFRTNSFDVDINLAVLLKVVVFDQITVSLCPPGSQITLTGDQIDVGQPPSSNRSR